MATEQQVAEVYYHNVQGGSPVLALTGNGNVITNGDATPSVGDDTDFGSTAKATVTKTYTITNSGTADLNGLSVTAPAGYTVTVQPAATLAPAANTTFSVRFDATAYQTYSGNVTIVSDELPDFTFAITGKATYALTVLATSPLRYNKLNEGSGSAIVDSSGNGYTGTYTGVTWDGTLSPVGEAAPFWDAANDYGDLYSAAFGTAFNLDEGTIMLWIKPSATFWTDGLSRLLFYWDRDGNNRVYLDKPASGNRLFAQRRGNVTAKNIDVAGISNSDWFSILFTWSVAGGGLLAAGESRLYLNGVQIGTTQTGNVASSGTGLNANSVILGAINKTPSNVHHGYFSQLAVWDRPADAAILALGVPA